MADGSYKVIKHKFSPLHGTIRKTGEREKPTTAAAWGEQKPTIIPDLPDSAIEPVDLEQIPAQPVSGLELTADQKWQALDEATRSQVEKLHQEHQERELEVKALESQAGMFAKFFNKQLKEAQKALAETRYKLEHPRYKQATELYRQLQARPETQAEPMGKSEKIQEMIAQRDQLRQEIEETSYSFLKRYSSETRAKTKQLQALEYKLQHPMYREEAIKGQPELEEKFFKGDDLTENYSDEAIVKEAEQHTGEEREKIKAEMERRGLPDVDYAVPGAAEVLRQAGAEAKKQPANIVSSSRIPTADFGRGPKPTFCYAKEEAKTGVMQTLVEESPDQDDSEAKLNQITQEISSLNLSLEGKNLVEQFQAYIKNEEDHKAMGIATGIREEILKTKDVKAYQLFNDWRKALKSWSERKERAFFVAEDKKDYSGYSLVELTGLKNDLQKEIDVITKADAVNIATLSKEKMAKLEELTARISLVEEEMSRRDEEDKPTR